MRDYRIPPNNFLFDCLERSWYDFLGNHHLIPHANTGKVDETIEFDCLVLSGGSDSVARNVTENNLFLHAIKRKKPILGVCHGAFVVNELTGGVNQIDYDLIPTHENSVHEVVMDGKKVMVNSYHGQTIKFFPSRRAKTFISGAQTSPSNDGRDNRSQPETRHFNR